MKATGLSQHSQYWIYLKQLLVFDLKRLQKERAGGREENNTFLAELSAPHKTTFSKGTGQFPMANGSGLFLVKSQDWP